MSAKQDRCLGHHAKLVRSNEGFLLSIYQTPTAPINGSKSSSRNSGMETDMSGSRSQNPISHSIRFPCD